MLASACCMNAANWAAWSTPTKACKWLLRTVTANTRTPCRCCALPRTPRIRSFAIGPGRRRNRLPAVRTVTSTTEPAGMNRRTRAIVLDCRRSPLTVAPRPLSVGLRILGGAPTAAPTPPSTRDLAGQSPQGAPQSLGRTARSPQRGLWHLAHRGTSPTARSLAPRQAGTSSGISRTARSLAPRLAAPHHAWQDLTSPGSTSPGSRLLWHLAGRTAFRSGGRFARGALAQRGHLPRDRTRRGPGGGRAGRLAAQGHTCTGVDRRRAWGALAWAARGGVGG
jgi:hypothetical protein